MNAHICQQASKHMCRIKVATVNHEWRRGAVLSTKQLELCPVNAYFETDRWLPGSYEPKNNKTKYISK